MDNEISEQVELTSEKILGKFDNVEALKIAYSNLESEFTKKCQRIRELEKASQYDTETLIVAMQSLLGDDEFVEKYVANRDNIREKIIGDYLIAKRTSSYKLMTGGGATLLSPPKSVKTLKEAKELADKIINN